jgi:hypothetical protein
MAYWTARSEMAEHRKHDSQRDRDRCHLGDRPTERLDDFQGFGITASPDHRYQRLPGHVQGAMKKTRRTLQQSSSRHDRSCIALWRRP